MQNKVMFDLNFARYDVRRWFDDNYFVVIYDTSDNYLASFDLIEELPKFFNQGLKKILYAIRRDNFLEFDGHKVKLYVYKKENEKGIKSRK